MINYYFVGFIWDNKEFQNSKLNVLNSLAIVSSVLFSTSVLDELLFLALLSYLTLPLPGSLWANNDLCNGGDHPINIKVPNNRFINLFTNKRSTHQQVKLGMEKMGREFALLNVNYIGPPIKQTENPLTELEHRDESTFYHPWRCWMLMSTDLGGVSSHIIGFPPHGFYLSVDGQH